MSAVAEVPITAPPAAAPGWAQQLTSMNRSARLRWGALLAVVVLALVAAFFYARQPSYRVLFAGLGDKDGGAIVAQLSQMNVPYKYAEGGGAIMVPADRVHDVRLRLATLGLPKGSVTGFEVMDTNRFGMTQFQERLNFQRGLEGELTRSIQSLDSVQSARVHLALPNQNGFFREQQKPSASVLVSLYPGRLLNRAQIAGIVHLVASSVPEMEPAAVSVLDDSGKLLSQSPDGAADTGMDLQHLSYVQHIEQLYQRRILEILEPVVGKGNVNAQVTAEVDFSKTDSTVEQHRPNQEPGASAVRSQQVLESAGEPGKRLPAGVPGAVSNQPPQNSTAPINGANPAPSAGSAQGGQAGGSVGKRESVTNYEVDKTTKVIRGSTGIIKRVSAAVVVNYKNVATNPDKPAENKPLSPEQIEQMTALVRETIGFNKERGDSVNLMNAPFFVPETPAAVNLPLWKQPEVIDLAKTAAWPVGISLAVALLLLGLARPMLKARAGAAKGTATGVAAQAEGVKPGSAVDALASEQLERPALLAPDEAQELQPTEEQLRLNDARKLAKENPVAVANILKGWVNGDA